MTSLIYLYIIVNKIYFPIFISAFIPSLPTIIPTQFYCFLTPAHPVQLVFGLLVIVVSIFIKESMLYSVASNNKLGHTSRIHWQDSVSPFLLS